MFVHVAAFIGWLVVIAAAFSWCVPAKAATLATPAHRHVYLNASGGGTQLNDCPNPAHAADGTSNAAELEYCPATTPHKFICDPGGAKVCKAWTVTTASCPTKLPVTNGASIDVDGDGSEQIVYGHPQACVWNMAPSDYCEVHSGTYKKAGTISDWRVASPGAGGVTDRSDCWGATVAALGWGANAAIGATAGAGYGTQAQPAYLRGAQMNGSTDSWDTNHNLTPDSAESVTRYPVVFSGDMNENGTPKEPTICTVDNAVGGDAFYPLMWGCGAGFAGSVDVCNHSGPIRPQFDTDANGTFDTMLPGGWTTTRDVSNFVIQDIEATGYSGGPTTCTGNGVREKLGHFSLGGNGSSGGFIADTIYFHDNAYSNLCANEHYCAIFGDDEDGSCARDHEIKRSNLMLDNRFVINDDSDSWDPGSSESGCGWYFHDNRVDVVSNPGCVGQGCRKGLVRFKSVDSLQAGARKKQFRIANNDITWETTTKDASFPWFIQTECIGQCGPAHPGLGEFWFYGNLFHYRSGAVSASPWGGFSCTSDGSPDSHQYRLYMFNNTWDGARTGAEATESMGGFCNSTGEIFTSRNNAFYRSTTVNTQTADTLRVASNVCSEAGITGCTQNNTNGGGGTPRTGWFTAGTWGVDANSALANYVPRTGGPLDETGSCDPDGDGVRGVDYYGAGNVTSWYDLKGNFVDCSGTNVQDIGAIQSSNDPGGTGAICGNGVKETGEACDGSDFGGATCASYACTGGSLTCTGCAAITITSCTGCPTPPGVQTIRGVVRGGRIGP